MLDVLLFISGLALLSTFTLTSWSTMLQSPLVHNLAYPSPSTPAATLCIELSLILISRFIFFWLPALFFYLLDAALPSITSQWKIYYGTNARFDGNAGRVAFQAMVNMLLGVEVQGLVEIALVVVTGSNSAVWVSSGMPLPGRILWDLVRGLVLREILHYYLHRFYLHSAPSLHGCWQHGALAWYPLWPATAHYDHLLPYLIHRFVPVYAPAVVFRFHALTYFAFIAIVSLEEVFTYSGYEKLFFSSLARGAAMRTAEHFDSDGSGNYSTWGVLDWLHGTMVDGDGAEENGEEER